MAVEKYEDLASRIAHDEDVFDRGVKAPEATDE